MGRRIRKISQGSFAERHYLEITKGLIWQIIVRGKHYVGNVLNNSSRMKDVLGKRDKTKNNINNCLQLMSIKDGV